MVPASAAHQLDPAQPPERRSPWPWWLGGDLRGLAPALGVCHPRGLSSHLPWFSQADLPPLCPCRACHRDFCLLPVPPWDALPLNTGDPTRVLVLFPTQGSGFGTLPVLPVSQGCKMPVPPLECGGCGLSSVFRSAVNWGVGACRGTASKGAGQGAGFHPKRAGLAQVLGQAVEGRQGRGSHSWVGPGLSVRHLGLCQV